MMASQRASRDGKLVIDMSSISPIDTKAFAEKVAAKGCDYVDAPVSGGQVGAEAASLTIMVGATDEGFARAKPLFELMGKNITHVGPIGAGQTTKVANQIIVALNIEAVAEALLFASKAGADPAKVRQALMGGFASSKILELHAERMINRTFDPGFRIKPAPERPQPRPAECPRQMGLSLPNTATAQELFNVVREHTAAAMTTTLALVKALERMADHKVAERLIAPHVSVSTRKCLPRRRQGGGPRTLSAGPHLPAAPAGRTLVIGAGKAGAAMARATEQQLDRSPLRPDRHALRPRPSRATPIEIVEAAHPVPDEKGPGCSAPHDRGPCRASKADDLVLCLISGGGSALLTPPGEGITLADKQDLNRALLKSGADITEMNTVRKHLSAIKGGRLATAAYPARVVTLAISDVPGDDPATVASGPTVADPTTVSDAHAVLAKYAIDPSASIKAFLATPAAETANPGDPRLATAEFHYIATPMASLEAAADICRQNGIESQILGDDLEGEARELAAEHAETARTIAASLKPDDSPVALISGGETTVTVRGTGRGGRNAEYLLALAVALDSAPGIHAIACDTDGIDGSEDNAGAIIGPDTLARAETAGLDAAAFLSNNDGYTFFKHLGDLVMTGPTLTNVNDFRSILIYPPSKGV